MYLQRRRRKIRIAVKYWATIFFFCPDCFELYHIGPFLNMLRLRYVLVYPNIALTFRTCSERHGLWKKSSREWKSQRPWNHRHDEDAIEVESLWFLPTQRPYQFSWFYLRVSKNRGRKRTTLVAPHCDEGFLFRTNLFHANGIGTMDWAFWWEHCYIF